MDKLTQKKQVPPTEFVNGVPYDEYRRKHPLTQEQLEENRLGLLREFAPAFYEFEMLEGRQTWTN